MRFYWFSGWQKTRLLSIFFILFFASHFFLIPASIFAQKAKPNLYLPDFKINAPERDFLDYLMKEDTSQTIYKVLFNPQKYRLQIIYTQVNRDKHNKPKFKTFNYRSNDQEYFYPASMVKLPVIALALEKLHKLEAKGLDINTTLLCNRNSGGVPMQTSIAEIIKKMLIVSDNLSYTILYEFVGPNYLHKRLREMGYSNVSITQNFSYADKPFKSFEFLTSEGQLIYEEIPEEKMAMPGIHVEKPYIDNKSFKNSNHLPLADIHKMLMALMFPESFPHYNRFQLTYDDYEFLHKYMSIFPRECKNPLYDENEFYDSVFKFFLNTRNKSRQEQNVRCFNKVGISYGFLTDCTYFVDYEKKIEYFISTVIYVNEHGNVADGDYEYYRTGFPFFSNLGRIIYNYELERERKNKPEFELINYE